MDRELAAPWKGSTAGQSSLHPAGLGEPSQRAFPALPHPPQELGKTWARWGQGEAQRLQRATGSGRREPSHPRAMAFLSQRHGAAATFLVTFSLLLPSSNLPGSSSFHFHPRVRCPQSMSHTGESRYFPGTVPWPRSTRVSQPLLLCGTRTIYIFSLQREHKEP